MNRIVIGALGALLLVAAGVFWWQGRAAVEAGAPPPELLNDGEATPAPGPLPTADVRGRRGPAPPEATEMSREQRRFARYDRNGDRIISRNELMATRTAAFRKLDADGNNLLTFEEWAVATGNRFKAADKDGNLQLNAEEFATTRPKPVKANACNCR
ncbi:EF-hand domain-containing protein [Novosphingobium tardum]|uniref:EF-hand domain-containing protein n=1 Tax=Novosphingobium tardum TaxID=1538021 RepID=A0ABV8RQ25_9SPHN